MAGDATPRTKLDFLYSEILGELSDLVKRLEVVSAAVAEVSRSRAADRSADALERAAAVSASRVRSDLERAAEKAGRNLATLVGQVVGAAEVARGARRWRAYAVCAGLSLVGSFVGGGLVVVLHHAGWW
jgi:hypothetical protein